MKKRAIVCGILLTLTLGCDSSRHTPQQSGSDEPETKSQTLTIKGSDTMVILAQKWAEAYMKKHPGVSLQVSGGGSGTGLAALLNGTTDLANASRQIKEKEKVKLKKRHKVEAHETRVAIDALAVYLHKDNPIEALSIADLYKIFRGQSTNWKEFGGPDETIKLYSRENNSGTYAYFKEHVLNKEDFSAKAQTLPGTAAVINAVSKDTSGIGYGGISYSEGVRAIPIRLPDGKLSTPTMENATSGSYPLSRFLHIYSAGEPKGQAADFLAFALSEEGQSIVDGVGYYPLPKTSPTK